MPPFYERWVAGPPVPATGRVVAAAARLCSYALGGSNRCRGATDARPFPRARLASPAAGILAGHAGRAAPLDPDRRQAARRLHALDQPLLARNAVPDGTR